MSTIASFSTILDARVKKIYSVVQASVVEEYDKYSNSVTWNQLQYVMTGVSGLAMGQVIADGQVPASDAPIQGNTKTFTQAIFTNRVRLSKASYYYLFTAKNGAKIDANIKTTVLNLKNSIVNLKNYYAQAILANGASTSFSFTPIGGFQGSVTVDTTTADTVALWSASHTREDGGANWSNTTTGVFSFANLLAMRSLHSLKKDARGLPLMSTLDTFMFRDASSAFFLASSIKKTLESGKYPGATPGTTGSFVDGNPTASFEIIPLIAYEGLGTSSVQWFGFDSKMVNENFGFQYIESMPLEISDLREDFVGNLDLIMTATLYCQFGAADLRGWYYSTGA
jgi:hypothetical protein